MNRRRLVIGSLAALATAVLLWLVCHPSVTEEDRVRQALAGMRAAVEAKDVRSFLDGLDDTFRGEDGIDRQTLGGILFAEFRRRGQIAVVMRGVSVEVDGARAKARLRVMGWEGAAGSGLPAVVPQDYQAFSVEARLHKTSGAWRIMEAEWTPISWQQFVAGSP